VIGKVLADSLAGGQGGHSVIDTALAHLPSHGGGETGALQVLASHDAATVPTWHSAEAAAFATAHTVFSMEAVMLHPDAAPAAHG